MDERNRMNWQHDAEGRIIEYGVARDPGGRVEDICETLVAAQIRVQQAYDWKAERYLDMLVYLEEKEAHEKGGPMPPTNEQWWIWERRAAGGPPIKERDWHIVRRTTTNWEQVT